MQLISWLSETPLIYQEELSSTTLVTYFFVCYLISYSVSWLIIFFSHVSTSLVVQVLLNVEVSNSHSDTPHLVRPLWTSDRPVATTSSEQHIQHSRETFIHPPGGIRTHNPKKPAAKYPRLKPHGHQDRLVN
jgi:hypothetical protein